MQLALFPPSQISASPFSCHLSWRAFLFVTLFVACTFFQIVAAKAETRTLKMYFTHTKETSAITFKKNGKYISSGLRKANRFLRDWRRKEPTKMDPALLDLVWEVYKASGSRKPIHVISGYRSPRTNSMLRRRGRGVAKRSQHTKGKALDFFLPDVSVNKLRALGLKAHRGGVGYYRGSFVHLDTGSVRHWPRMSKRQLSKVFPRGKTIHVPTTGRPLRGYKVAKANLKRGLNADGSKRRTSVQRSLLARLLSPKSDDGDEGEGAEETTPAKPAPAKKKPAPKPAVVVAAKPKKPSGPDPFLAEANAAKKQPAPVTPTKNPTSEEERQRLEAQQAIAAAGGGAPSDSAEAETVEVATSLVPQRAIVPTRRPSIAIASVSENKLEPIAATEIALAAPQAITDTLRPSVPVPNPQALAPVIRPVPPTSIPTTVALAATEQKNIESLKSRITTALATPRGTTPVQRALEAQQNSTLLAAIQKLPVPRTAQRGAVIAARVNEAVLAPKPVENKVSTNAAAVPVPKVAELPIPVQQASLQPDNIARPSTRPQLKRPSAQTVPAPKAQSANVVPAPSGLKPELTLGDLDGSSVKAWAVASSTRVGPTAALKAPNYRQSTKRIAPASVYSQGFASNGSPLRADRFSGNALRRVAFAQVGSIN